MDWFKKIWLTFIFENKATRKIVLFNELHFHFGIKTDSIKDKQHFSLWYWCSRKKRGIWFFPLSIRILSVFITGVIFYNVDKILHKMWENCLYSWWILTKFQLNSSNVVNRDLNSKHLGQYQKNKNKRHPPECFTHKDSKTFGFFSS